MMNQMREDFDEIVGISEDGGIVMLQELFDHGDNFKGATGCIMYPIKQSEVDNYLDPVQYEDHYLDLWIDAVRGRHTQESFADFVEGLISDCDYQGLLHPFDDDSFTGDLDTAFTHLTEDQLKLVKEYEPEDCVGWRCNSCGRIFGVEFKHVFRQDLFDRINEVEDKKNTIVED